MKQNKWMAFTILGALIWVSGKAAGQAPAQQQAPPPAQQPTSKFPPLINRRPVMLTPAQSAMLHEQNRLYDAAGAALDAGQYAEAEDLAQQSMAIGLDEGFAQEVYAAALNAEGKTQEALTAYQKMSDEGDAYPRTQLPYALLLLKTGHWPQAVAAYNNQLPYLAEGKLMNANSHFSPDVPQPKDLETAIHIALGLTEDWRGYSRTLPFNTQTLAQFRQAYLLEPNSALTNFYYGHGLARAHQKAEAKAAFAKAAQLGQGDVKAAAQEEMRY